MAGGRPRNDWKASRERKLARLYILSNLGWDDIKEVLREEGFDPSLSDMQKRLRTLLPNDYAVCYRGYHPSSHDQAKLRFSQLKFCTNDRVRKRRKSRLQAKADHKYAKIYTRPGSNSPELAGPCVIPSWLHIMAADNIPASIRSIEDSNELVPISIGCDISKTAEGDLKGSEMAIKCSQNSSHLVEGLNLPSVLSTHGVDDQLSPSQPGIEESTGHGANIASRALSSLFSRKLTDRHSRASLEHIESVVRYSLSNSWRSSLMSWTSSLNSRNSIASSIRQRWSISEDATSMLGSSGPLESRQKMRSQLTEGEQRIWDDLIDETQLAPPVRAEIPSYPELSLISRPCCAMLGKPKCQTCGFSYSHRQAIIWAKYLPTQFYTGDALPYSHDQDYFRNTPLHFAAANGSSSLLAMVKWLLLKRVDIKVKNTSGETFMHVLNPAQLDNTKEYISMLELLAEHNFPLSGRNYYGQSLGDIHLSVLNQKDIPSEHLSAIVSHLKLKSYDNERQRRLNLDTLLTRCLNSIPEKKSWRSKSMWRTLIRMPDLENLVQKIENSGDSSVIHLVKNWPDRNAFELEHAIAVILDFGAEINWRDRNGDTALAIAAIRGLRPAVFWLLRERANPNTRNYQGKGILSQATKYLSSARIDPKCYSRILSCVALLMDQGAKVNPTVYDEWAAIKIRGGLGHVQVLYSLGLL